MTNQIPYEGPLGDDDDPAREDDADLGDGDGVLGDVFDDDDRPLDPDLNDDQIDSAAADERAATEGTVDVDDRP
ncbi:hypothetical protein [Microbacterium sp. E-13]|uniref:hypothetical protein n=1 Tax=Microbacterium sp. E-13 TaxID=3404048 RepID=UPI003CF58BE7